MTYISAEVSANARQQCRTGLLLLLLLFYYIYIYVVQTLSPDMRVGGRHVTCWTSQFNQKARGVFDRITVGIAEINSIFVDY